MILTSVERVLVHLHGYWNAAEAGAAMTQVGIAEGAHLLRSHVPRAVQTLIREGLVEERAARLRGRSRKVAVYALTPAGVSRARELVDALDAASVEVDGRTMSLGEARRALGLPPLVAALGVDSAGRLLAPAAATPPPALLQREADLAFLRRWAAGAVPIAVVYGARGMGKTSLARAFAAFTPRSAWIDLDPRAGLPAAAQSLAPLVRRPARDLGSPAAFADAVLSLGDAGIKLLVVDGYGEVPEPVVEAFSSLVRLARERPGFHVLVLAQEGTPAYCRFYGRDDLEARAVVEHRLKGLDLEGCRAMLGAGIDEEALRRIYLLTKGCPSYLEFIRRGDPEGLRAHSRFTKAEIRLLLYSGRVAGSSASSR